MIGWSRSTSEASISASDLSGSAWYQETSAKIYDYGFHVLSLMILSPRLWFRYVNPLLAAKVGYDLARVNLDGDAYVELMEAYHRIEV